MIDLQNRNRTLPMHWRRRCNDKPYTLGDIKADTIGIVRVWIYEDNSNRCLHITLERLCRTFRAL
jgi:hypothetical protein